MFYARIADTPNMETQDKDKKQWPKTYSLRPDGTILFPPELLLVLGWRKGDKMAITLGSNMVEIRPVGK